MQVTVLVASAVILAVVLAGADGHGNPRCPSTIRVPTPTNVDVLHVMDDSYNNRCVIWLPFNPSMEITSPRNVKLTCNNALNVDKRLFPYRNGEEHIDESGIHDFDQSVLPSPGAGKRYIAIQPVQPDKVVVLQRTASKERIQIVKFNDVRHDIDYLLCEGTTDSLNTFASFAKDRPSLIDAEARLYAIPAADDDENKDKDQDQNQDQNQDKSQDQDQDKDKSQDQDQNQNQNQDQDQNQGQDEATTETPPPTPKIETNEKVIEDPCLYPNDKIRVKQCKKLKEYEESLKAKESNFMNTVIILVCVIVMILLGICALVFISKKKTCINLFRKVQKIKEEEESEVTETRSKKKKKRRKRRKRKAEDDADDDGEEDRKRKKKKSRKSKKEISTRSSIKIDSSKKDMSLLSPIKVDPSKKDMSLLSPKKTEEDPAKQLTAFELLRKEQMPNTSLFKTAP